MQILDFLSQDTSIPGTSITMTILPGRAQPDITSGSGCPGNFKCPDSGLPVFFLPGLIRVLEMEKSLLFSAILKFTFCQLFLMTSQQQSMVSWDDDSMC